MAETTFESFGFCSIVISGIYKQSEFSYKRIRFVFFLKYAICCVKTVTVNFVV